MGHHVHDARFPLQAPVDHEEGVPPHHAPQTCPRVRPERDVDHPGLVLQGKEDGPLRGHRVLAGHDQAADAHGSGPALRERRARHRSDPGQRRAEEPDHLAPCVERQDRVAVAEPLQLGERREIRRRRGREPQVQRPAGDPATAPGRSLRGPGHLPKLPEELPARTSQRIERTRPDQPLQHFLG